MSARAWVAAVLAGAVVAGACAIPAPPTPPPAASLGGAGRSASAIAASSTSYSPPALLPMMRPFDQPACGGGYTWEDWPGRAERRRQGGASCFSVAGCPEPDPPWAGKMAECPPWPTKTVEDTVREARASPAEQDVVVRGRLVVTTGPRARTERRQTPCDEDTLPVSIEATVEGDCYAIRVRSSLQCDVDASRLCCDHLPLNREVAIAGRLTHRPGLDVFAFEIDGVLCRPPPAPPPMPASTIAP